MIFLLMTMTKKMKMKMMTRMMMKMPNLPRVKTLQSVNNLKLNISYFTYINRFYSILLCFFSSSLFLFYMK
ncbi:hypothetical protein BD408DRAFT_278311 [Parasitella parasitica]|nr:hypothetical protein BD408DRAFT_278311 [Parasitella parasitica]